MGSVSIFPPPCLLLCEGPCIQQTVNQRSQKNNNKSSIVQHQRYLQKNWNAKTWCKLYEILYSELTELQVAI